MEKTSIDNCADFLYLYPKDYEFYMDEIIHLWIAQGFFVTSNSSLEEEDDALVCFEMFVSLKIIESSRVDPSSGRLRYKLNHSSLVDVRSNISNDYYFRSDDVDSYISRNTAHASIRDSFDPNCLKDLYQIENLRTLLILHEYKSRLDQLPRHLFLKFPLLTSLELSHTNIKDLPSSIRNLKDLRYLNLSSTPITTLPDSLCTLSNLQTLNLRGCSKLIRLPKGMSQLTKLRHLNVDVTCLLVSMPPGFGALAELQTLPAFIVGKENGCHITELKQMKNLRGTFRILRLENVSSSKEARQAALEQKKYLNKLELHWTKLQDGLELLENLRPCIQIEELEVLGYGGAKFPLWIGEPLFIKLTNITIHDCRKCEVLPPLGQLLSLESLCISDMHAIKVIDHHFCGRNLGMESLDSDRLELGTALEDISTASMFKAFPALKNLTINGMPMLEEWCGMEEKDFPHLQNLNISNCSKLTALPKLSHLKFLKKLEISLDPSLQCFSKEGLPTSLQYLVIIDCPLLKEKCFNDEEEFWQKLGDIPNIWIDYQQMTKKVNEKKHDDEKKGKKSITMVLNVDLHSESRAQVMNYIMKYLHSESRAQVMNYIVKFEGAESVQEHRPNSMVEVTGRFDPVMIISNLRSKINKVVTMVSLQPTDNEDGSKEISDEISSVQQPSFKQVRKVILQLDLHDDKDKKKAMKTVSGVEGIHSISMDMKDKKLTAIGDIDPVNIVSKLRKFWHTEIVSVGPAKEPEKKKEEPKKEEPKKEEPNKDDTDRQITDVVNAYKAIIPI